MLALGLFVTETMIRKPQISSCSESWNLCATQDTKLAITIRASAGLESPSWMS